MRRLRTLTILVSLNAGGQIASADAPRDPSPPVQTVATSEAVANPVVPANRPEPPVAPQKYLKAGVLLFNKQRYDLAAKYFEASQVYRDRLTPNERIVLDEFRDQLARYLRDQKQVNEAVTTAIENRTADPKVTAASTTGAAAALDMSGSRTVSAPAASEGASPTLGVAKPLSAAPVPEPSSNVSTEVLRGTADVKQKGRWLLHQARELVHDSKFGDAERVVAEARGLNIKWGYFDDTPDKVTETITKAKAMASVTTAFTNPPRDRRAARARLREARAALTANDIEKADAIARNVRGWDLRYGLLDDTPDKVAAAVGEARRRAAVQNAEMIVRSYVGSDSSSRGEPAAPVAPNSGSPGPR